MVKGNQSAVSGPQRDMMVPVDPVNVIVGRVVRHDEHQVPKRQGNLVAAVTILYPKTNALRVDPVNELKEIQSSAADFPQDSNVVVSR